MFSAGPDTGSYPGPGAPADVETDEGTAHIVGLGGPVHELSFIESLISLFYMHISNLQFGYCAADVDALLAAELTTSTVGLLLRRLRRLRMWPANGQLTKTPSQTRRYLLTEGLRQANLLGSMYARFEDASQRPVTFACGG